MTDKSGVIETSLDVLLVLLYAGNEEKNERQPIQGVTRLQKLLFLLWKEAEFYEHVQDLYGFDAYDFGPCMDDLYDDIDFAVDIGLIRVQEVPSGNEYAGGDEEAFLGDFGFRFAPSTTRRDYSLTSDGREAAREMYDALAESERKKITYIKSHFGTMPFFSLLRYVYQKYPEFAKKSILSI